MLLLLLMGCAAGSSGDIQMDQEAPDAASVTAVSEDLMVTLQLPATMFTPGDTIPTRVVAANPTDSTIVLHTTSDVPCFLVVEAYDSVRWQLVGRYPRVVRKAQGQWRLSQEDTRVFARQLTVEPDWPTYTPLRVRAELQGRQDVSPAVHIEIVQPADLKNPRNEDLWPK